MVRNPMVYAPSKKFQYDQRNVRELCSYIIIYHEYHFFFSSGACVVEQVYKDTLLPKKKKLLGLLQRVIALN
jgi:hypothetical protein